MINRINLILRAKNITARQFAEEIGIQPSGMSHILGGRNNPSLDFAVKVLKRYPEIDANWLLLGKGAMYGGTPAVAASAANQSATAPANDGVTSAVSPGVETFAAASAPAAVEMEGAEATLFDDGVGEQPQQKAEDYQALYVAVPPKEVERGHAPLPAPALDEEGDAAARLSAVPAPGAGGDADGGGLCDAPVRMLFVYADNTYEVLSPRERKPRECR